MGLKRQIYGASQERAQIQLPTLEQSSGILRILRSAKRIPQSEHESCADADHLL